MSLEVILLKTVVSSFSCPRALIIMVKTVPHRRLERHTVGAKKGMGALKAHWIFGIYKMEVVYLLSHYRNWPQIGF